MKKQLLILVLPLLPMLASADDFGTCDENLSWTYIDDTKTLTISGSGKMHDYSNSFHAPWYGIKDRISKVKLLLVLQV